MAGFITITYEGTDFSISNYQDTVYINLNKDVIALTLEQFKKLANVINSYLYDSEKEKRQKETA